jgi:hypothetical protein
MFSASTLIMPYANYDDTKSLVTVFNNFLSQDPDMDLGEFIAEKLFVSMQEDEEEGNSTQKNVIPIAIQIQHGVVYQSQTQQIEFKVRPVESAFSINYAYPFIIKGFEKDIFRPPLA